MAGRFVRPNTQHHFARRKGLRPFQMLTGSQLQFRLPRTGRSRPVGQNLPPPDRQGSGNRQRLRILLPTAALLRYAQGRAYQRLVPGSRSGRPLQYLFRRLPPLPDQHRITRVNLSKEDEIPIGTEIVRVNGLATQDYYLEGRNSALERARLFLRGE